MSKYKLLSQEGYYEEDGLTPGEIYDENYLDTHGTTVKKLVETYPKDWKLVKESKAMRFNENKPQLSLISLKELEPMADVLAFGAKKYARDNWKKGLVVSEVLDSMMRHIAALQSGELVDPESGLPHIGHIQANALFLGSDSNINDMRK